MPSISLTNPANITRLDFSAISTQKLGGVINVSALENLQDLTCDGNDITEVTGYENNTNMKILLITNNKISGTIPDLTGMTSLERCWISGNELTGGFPNINGLSKLGIIHLGNNDLTGTLPTDLQSLGLPNLFRFNIYLNSFTGAIPDCTGMTKLQFVLAHNNSLTDFTGGVEPSLYRFEAWNNNLTETAVDNILQAFVDANRTTNMSSAIINLGGSGNAPPSAAGEANVTILRNRGWSVTTN
jgi:Leucine-rich repeat (LRR) protein